IIYFNYYEEFLNFK
ncbi:hypothetical protein FOXB_02821, partial [Fusarium oxysporum f. sp. conglutinans Fo5176]